MRTAVYRLIENFQMADWMDEKDFFAPLTILGLNYRAVCYLGSTFLRINRTALDTARSATISRMGEPNSGTIRSIE